MRRGLLVSGLLLLAACGDDGDADDVVAEEPAPGGAAVTFEGTITQVTAFEPVTEGCVPASDLDPAGSVSSDDPPLGSDPAPAPLGSRLVEGEPGVAGGEKLVFTVPAGAPITWDGDAVDFADLTEGDVAEVGFDGTVAESYPGQATAATVEVRA